VFGAFRVDQRVRVVRKNGSVVEGNRHRLSTSADAVAEIVLVPSAE